MVSVIIINYNTFELTCNCIQSVLDRTKELPFEIVLVDNASSEKNPAEFEQRFPQIVLVKSESNIGFAKGNNLGIKHSKGEVILLLNSDTQLINNAILEGFNVLMSDDMIGVVSGKLLSRDGSVQGVAGRFPGIGQELFDLFRLSKFLSAAGKAKRYMGMQANYDEEIDCDWVWGTYFMFRRSDLRSFPNGRLHENFFMYYEDVQWCYHFKMKLKKRIVYSPLPLLYHFIGGSNTGQSLGEKYVHQVFRNEYDWISNEKGFLYVKVYYLLKALHLMSGSSQTNKQMGRFYWKNGFTRNGR